MGKDKSSVVIRVWKRTRHKLKIIAAIRGRTMTSLLEEMVSREFDNLSQLGLVSPVYGEEKGEND